MTFAKGSLGAAALFYAERLRWRVFPLQPRAKIPMPGTSGFKDASSDLEQVRAWWSATPDANIGLATGEGSGVVVVDIDGPEGEEALAMFGALPACPVSTTGKGRHLLFRAEEGLRNTAGRLGPKLDTRGDGGYIVLPPSVHPSGARYRWDAKPWDVELPALPAAIADRLRGVVGRIAAPGEPAIARAAAVEVALNGVEEGGRNHALAEYVGRLLSIGARELEVLELARGLNATKFRPPLDDREVEAVVRSIAGAHARNRSARPAAPSSPRVVAMEPVGMPVLEEMAERSAAPVDALPTMWPSWNRACRQYGGQQGWARGWHIVVAGGAGVGKSLVALNATASALFSGHRVGWVSLEMSREQLLLRLLGIGTGYPLRLMEPGPHFEPQTFAAAAHDLMVRIHERDAALVVAERPPRELPRVLDLMRDAIEQGCRLLVLDYLQLVSVPGVTRRDEAMTAVSNAIQELCYAHRVNTLALSQFNRATTANQDASPTVFGLAGSSALENDADQVLLLDHTSKEDVASGRRMTALLEKNRHGPSTTIRFLLDHNTLRMVELAGEAAAVEPPRAGSQLPLNDRGHRRDYWENYDR